MAKYYISQGLGTNALNILNKLIADKAPETETERFHGLLGVANFLAGRYEQALENFSFGRLPEINEAVFWRTLAASALEPTPENNAVLISYLNLVRNYPPEIRSAIAKVGAVTAIAAGDDITAQSFIDILKTMDTPRNLMPLVNYLTAEKSSCRDIRATPFRNIAKQPTATTSNIHPLPAKNCRFGNPP